MRSKLEQAASRIKTEQAKVPYHLGPAYKSARRARYQEDEEYRQRCIETATEHRRKVMRESPSAREYRDTVTGNLSRMEDFGTWHAIRVQVGRKPSHTSGVTFSTNQIARLIARRPEAVAGWQDRGLFPEPRHAVLDENGKETGRRVYTAEEARKLALAAKKWFYGKSTHLASQGPKAVAEFHAACC